MLSDLIVNASAIRMQSLAYLSYLATSPLFVGSTACMCRAYTLGPLYNIQCYSDNRYTQYTFAKKSAVLEV